MADAADSPAVIRRYLQAADEGDIPALAECFTVDGVVVDENETHRGRDEIVHWRESLASKWIYTSTLTGTESLSDGEYRAFVHIAGNFPGGEADLTYRFTLAGDLIAKLHIG